MSKIYTYALDLKDDPQLIEEYKKYHEPGGVWPEVLSSIREAGILDMRIFLGGDRLFLIMEVDDNFDPEARAKADADNQKVQDWEELMWNYQIAVPWAKPGQKWAAMEQVFHLSEHP